ncbi:MAG: tyrosine-type recombinase/integrase, partial [Clostridia bacterium]|nr:tyrosine-type recombinase/integrase [Clostridia bacterium]
GKVYDLFFYVVTLDGERKQKRLSGFKTKTAAKESYTEFVTKHCTLTKSAPITKKAEKFTGIPTVADLVPQYIASLHNQTKESTIYDRQNVFNATLLPMIGNAKITDLTKERLYQWQDELWALKNPKTGMPYGYNYLSSIRSHFSAFLSWADSRHGYPNNLKKIEKPKKRAAQKEMLFWTREEFDRFIEVVDDPRYKMMFTMSFFTGRRKGEILALGASDVRAESILFNKTYTRKTVDGTSYKITTSKNEKIGYTPICPALRSALNGYKNEAPFFFGGNEPIHENTLAHAFEAYQKKADVKRIRYHDLRHSYVSMLLHHGANFMVVADLIGDTVDQVIKTYGHLYESDKTKIVESIL